MGAMTENERLLATFLDLVRIDSPSGSEAACARYCADALSACGCSVRYDDSAAVTGSDTGNLIADLPGDVPATLVLSAHMDCVEPCRGVVPEVRDGVVSAAGETILGGDDKVGLAAIIETVRRLTASGDPRPAIRCVLTVKEEVGLLGAKSLEPGAAAGDLCLVLDAAGAPGGIAVGAPTHYTFTAEFFGRASHAGVAPEEGISAIAMAADAVCAMDLGRLDEQTTANVGSISGGSATNVVPPSVSMTGECRSLDSERVEQVRAAMHDAMTRAAGRAGGEVSIEWTREYGGFTLDESSPEVALVKNACAEIGLAASTFRTGGGSDANVIAATGMPTLALATGMTDVHSTGERLAVADLEALTALTVAIARKLAG